MALFLTPDEVAELCGIRRGRNGFSRHELQVAQLRTMGVAFRINAAGRPIVTVAAVEGGSTQKNERPARPWRSYVLNSSKQA